MRVYHTSNVIVSKPDTQHSRKALDFGVGFYLTPIKEQAIKYGQRFVMRGEQAILNTYELSDEWKKYRVKTFDSYDEEWLDFVMANREGKGVETYDAIEGGIADDKVFRTIDLFFSGDIDKKEALRRLSFEYPNFQICLLKQEIIDKCLTYISSEEI
ncbi:MAG: DUF3990 domain-containing protein [Prevotella sp.]|nr:DUF3990 domain-containing protein [Prevotella sp.]